MSASSNRYARIRSIIKGGFFWIVTAFILIIVLSAAEVPIFAELVPWEKVAAILSNSDAFLSSIVQAVATILAIQFSVSILAVQHASTNYSPNILERYRRNPRVLFAYTFETSALVISSFALLGARSQALLLTSFVMFLATLGYLFAHFSLTLSIVNPKSVIRSLEKDVISRIQRVVESTPTLEKKKWARLNIRPRRTAIPLFLIDRDALDTSRDTIISSVNILQNSVIRRDYETSVYGFRSIVSITNSYVDATRSFIRSDDAFITFLLEQLYGVTKVAFENPDLMILIEAVRAIGLVGYVSLPLAPSQGTSNYATKLSIHYIADLGTQSLTRQLNDAAAEATQRLTDIGSEGLRKIGDDSLAQQSLAAMGKLASRSGQWFVTRWALTGLLTTLSSGVTARQPWAEIDRACDGLADVASQSVQNGQGRFVIYSIAGGLPGTGLLGLARETLSIKQGPFPIVETAGREGYVREIFRLLIETLEKVGISGVKANDGLVVLNVSEALHSIGVLMIDEKFVYPKAFSEEIERLLSTLAAMYPRSEKSLAEPFVPQALAHLAADLTDHGFDGLAKGAAESLQALAIGAIRSDDKYTSQRVAENLVTIGSYAVKLGKRELSEKCMQLLMEFDKKYNEDTKNPEEMLYLNEVTSEFGGFREEETEIALEPENIESFKQTYLAKKAASENTQKPATDPSV